MDTLGIEEAISLLESRTGNYPYLTSEEIERLLELLHMLQLEQRNSNG